MKDSNPSFLTSMVCISVGIHGLLFFILIQKEPKEVREKPFKIEWQTVNEPTSPVQMGSRQKISQPGKSKSSQMLSDNLQKVLRTDWAAVAVESQQEEFAQEIEDVDIAAHGIKLNLEKQLRDEFELPQLWKQIRLALRYRPEHALARIDGDVQVRIRVDRNGKLLKIFEQGATGRDELVGWTILCLLEAFRKPFLKEPLNKSRTLDLRVQYTMQRKVLASEAKSARMLFVIEGDLYTGSNEEERVPIPKGHLGSEDPTPHIAKLPFEIPIIKFSTKQIMETFKDKTLKNHMEWNYYTQLEAYRDQCHRHLNAQACAKLKEITKHTGP